MDDVSGFLGFASTVVSGWRNALEVGSCKVPPSATYYAFSDGGLDGHTWGLIPNLVGRVHPRDVGGYDLVVACGVFNGEDGQTLQWKNLEDFSRAWVVVDAPANSMSLNELELLLEIRGFVKVQEYQDDDVVGIVARKR